jgi:hypothetical protein
VRFAEWRYRNPLDDQGKHQYEKFLCITCILLDQFFLMLILQNQCKLIRQNFIWNLLKNSNILKRKFKQIVNNSINDQISKISYLCLWDSDEKKIWKSSEFSWTYKNIALQSLLYKLKKKITILMYWKIYWIVEILKLFAICIFTEYRPYSQGYTFQITSEKHKKITLNKKWLIYYKNPT